MNNIKFSIWTSMDYIEFKNTLKKHNLEIDSWAKEVGLTYSGVTNWRNATEVPGWVDSWFKLYEEKRAIENFKKIVIDMAEKFKETNV